MTIECVQKPDGSSSKAQQVMRSLWSMLANQPQRKRALVLLLTDGKLRWFYADRTSVLISEDFEPDSTFADYLYRILESVLLHGHEMAGFKYQIDGGAVFTTTWPGRSDLSEKEQLYYFPDLVGPSVRVVELSEKTTKGVQVIKYVWEEVGCNLSEVDILRHLHDSGVDLMKTSTPEELSVRLDLKALREIEAPSPKVTDNGKWHMPGMSEDGLSGSAESAKSRAQPTASKEVFQPSKDALGEHVNPYRPVDRKLVSIGMPLLRPLCYYYDEDSITGIWLLKIIRSTLSRYLAVWHQGGLMQGGNDVTSLVTPQRTLTSKQTSGKPTSYFS